MSISLNLLKNINVELKDKPSSTMAYLAHLSYHDSEFYSKTLYNAGAINVISYDKTGTQAFLAEFDEYIVISFRGSSQKRDWKQDLMFWKREWNGVRAHHGFSMSLDKISGVLLKDIATVTANSPNKKLIFTGHSLGAALSTLLTILVKPYRLYTFGGPRAGYGDAFSAHFKDVQVYRYTNLWDLIAYLPQPFLLYQHVCDPIILSTAFMNPFKAHYSTTYITKVEQYYSDKEQPLITFL